MTENQTKRNEWLKSVKEELKKRDMSIAAFAKIIDFKAKDVRTILDGDWPYGYDYLWPLSFEQKVVEILRINPPAVAMFE